MSIACYSLLLSVLIHGCTSEASWSYLVNNSCNFTSGCWLISVNIRVYSNNLESFAVKAWKELHATLTSWKILCYSWQIIISVSIIPNDNALYEICCTKLKAFTLWTSVFGLIFKLPLEIDRLLKNPSLDVTQG